MKSVKAKNRRGAKAGEVHAAISAISKEVGFPVIDKANKALGQNFLIDEKISNSIAESFSEMYESGCNDDAKSNIVLEVGPGLGMLTRSIIKIIKPAKLLLVEKDARFIKTLQKRCEILGYENAEIINQDILAFDESEIYVKHGDNKIDVIANLPYNIGTELIFRWLEKLDYFSSITVMLQKEVADRLISEAGGAKRAWLGVVSEIFCESKKILDVDEKAFWPSPKVKSAVIRLVPRKERLYKDISIKDFKKVCSIAFGGRRKMLRKSLSILEIDWNLAKSVDPSSRPQELTIAQWAEICSLVKFK